MVRKKYKFLHLQKKYIKWYWHFQNNMKTVERSVWTAKVAKTAENDAKTIVNYIWQAKNILKFKCSLHCSQKEKLIWTVIKIMKEEIMIY